MRLVLVVAALATAALACSPRDLTPRDRTEIDDALEQAGLRICTTDESPSLLSGTDQVIAHEVAVGGCDSDVTGEVVVASAPSESERDRIVAALLAVPRPRFADAVWKLGTTMVVLAGVPDDDVVDRVQDAMRSLGAG